MLQISTKPGLIDSDAVVVARSWFLVGKKVTVEDVTTNCDEYALEPLPPGTKLRQALIHFGHELVNNECVRLSKPAGITREDIVKLIN